MYMLPGGFSFLSNAWALPANAQCPRHELASYCQYVLCKCMDAPTFACHTVNRAYPCKPASPGPCKGCKRHNTKPALLFPHCVSEGILDDSCLKLCNACEPLLKLCALSPWCRCGRSCGPLQSAAQCGGLEDKLSEAERGAAS